MKIQACPLCLNSNPIEYSQAASIKLAQCPSCSLVFQTHPKLVEFEQSNSLYGANNLTWRRVVRSEHLSIAKNRMRWIAKYLSGNGKLLEIGGATGEFCHHAMISGWDPVMIELSKEFADEAESLYHVHVIRELLTSNLFSESHFDLAVMFHVLEHLPSPRDTLETIKHFLKPGGYIAIIVPNLDSFTDHIYGRYNANLNQPDHLFHYTPVTLQKMLRSAGYTIIDCRTYEPAHHIITSFTGFLRTIRNHHDNGNNQQGPLNISQVKARAPYLFGKIISPLTIAYRGILHWINKGHEVFCVARNGES